VSVFFFLVFFQYIVSSDMQCFAVSLLSLLYILIECIVKYLKKKKKVLKNCEEP
jgi:hypothetical protein